MRVNRRGFLSMLAVTTAALSVQTWQRSAAPYEDPMARFARILDKKNVPEHNRFLYIPRQELLEADDG